VRYKNKLLRAEISIPDMHNPIRYALYERNILFETQVADSLSDFGDYHFKEFDLERYPVIKYAKDVISKKGLKGVILNAANEEAVYAFLEEKIPFLEIENIIDIFMNKYKNKLHPTLQQIIKMDKRVRKDVRNYIKNY
jgi:1-deoxy-D-xylulose-5-phosphate reductoisomerase